MKKAIIFIQLPLINHSYDYIQGNIDYASASIAGYIKKYISSDTMIYTLPDVLAYFGSDSVIVKYVTALRPDVVAFTCFLWNIERNLHIARLIKQQDSTIQIIFGGSEINEGSIAFFEKREYVDYFVIGEGEWFFKYFITGRDTEKYERVIGGNRVVVQPGNELVPADMIFEPFIGRRLTPMLDGSMFFELTRGCPYKCAYCQYSKNYNSIRELPFEMLVRALTGGGVAGSLKELYILSPALNKTKDFTKKLEHLSGLNHGIRLHSEMRADGIDEKKARLLYRAGFRSMEVGLQTLNVNSLKTTGRGSNTDKELRGMRCLLQAGIDLKIGLMPGLPGDDRSSFVRMVDMLVDMGFQESIELYPLMILPGTEIRDRANRNKTRYSRKPPYYYHDGWGMSFDDIRYITGYVEEVTGLSHIVRKAPDFANHDEGLYCRGIQFDGNDGANWHIIKHVRHIETNVFSVYILHTGATNIERGLPQLLDAMPANLLLNIIFYSNDILDEKMLIAIMENREVDNLFRRLHIFHEWKEGCPVRYYQVFDNHHDYQEAKALYGIVTPVLHIREHNAGDISLINDYEDHVLIAKGAYSAVKKSMKKFADSAHTVAFEDESEQEEFYTLTGYNFIRLPFQFRVMKL
jgi:radical SAM superfamily enzyme YgiQ (UPF0313 family)